MSWLKLALAGFTPLSVALGGLLFLAIVYVHDRGCDPFYRPVLNGSQAIAVEFRSETGSLVLSERRFNLDKAQALPDDCKVLHATRILSILDVGDFGYVKLLFPDADSVSGAVREISATLNVSGASSEEAGKIILRVAELMEKVHADVEQATRGKRQPILFRFDPPFVAELRNKARQETGRLKEKVEEFKREAGYESSNQPITVSLEGPPDQLNKLIRLSEESCRLSRVAFVVMYTISDGTGRDRGLRQEFIASQKAAEEITRALSQHERLTAPSYSDARTALTHFADSMQRRIDVLGSL